MGGKHRADIKDMSDRERTDAEQHEDLSVLEQQKDVSDPAEDERGDDEQTHVGSDDAIHRAQKRHQQHLRRVADLRIPPVASDKMQYGNADKQRCSEYDPK